MGNDTLKRKKQAIIFNSICQYGYFARETSRFKLSTIVCEIEVGNLGFIHRKIEELRFYPFLFRYSVGVCLKDKK